MKHIKSFLSSLIESYNTKVDIKWVDKSDRLIGLFSVDENVYQINCIDRGNDIWTYKFYLYDQKTNELLPELTNFNSGKMSILSAIRDGMDYLIEKKSPNCLIFASLDKSEGRKKLYFRYSKEIESEFGFKLNTALFDDKEVFILYRNGVNVDDIDKVVQDLINEIINEI